MDFREVADSARNPPEFESTPEFFCALLFAFDVAFTPDLSMIRALMSEHWRTNANAQEWDL